MLKVAGSIHCRSAKCAERRTNSADSRRLTTLHFVALHCAAEVVGQLGAT